MSAVEPDQRLPASRGVRGEIAELEDGAMDANSKIDACPPINGVRSKPSSTFSTVNA